MADQYKYPYFDASVFIGFIKDETVDGVERGSIADYLLKQARDG